MSSEEERARKREYARQYRAANKERIRENAQRHYQANKERIKERQRLAYQANPEPYRERVRHRYKAEPEKVREQNRRSYEANHERWKQSRQERRRNGQRSAAERRKDAIIAERWHAQRELCYLCEEPLALKLAVLEHDHRCCPKQNTYCAYCIRGVACTQCNTAIGLLRDNPELLERVARNLRVKLAETAAVIAAKPTQETLEAG